MTTTAVETIPTIWDDARDGAFFRITARLFAPAFCFGASVLLASYDDATVDSTARTSTGHSTELATVDTRTQPDRDLSPVRVRRTR